MKARMRQNISPSQKITIKPVWLIAGGIALAAVAVFAVILLLNLFGTNEPAAAAARNKYPFDLEDANLRNVNFTVLDTRINSVFSEVRPLISADGKTLFFSRRNHPDNLGREKDRQDIWFATLQPDGAWSTPANAGPTINTKSMDAICSVSADGQEIVFMHEDMSRENQLFRARRDGDGWQQPVPMIIENYYTKDPYVDFYYVFSERVLLMAITRQDSHGQQDLYVSRPIGSNRWSEPVNMGPVVNSKQSDFAPFLSADSRTLYFASYGHSGLGGCDIFQSTRLDDTWLHWSKPVNLGEGISSQREESYFSISGDNKHIYFESYDRKQEVRDIFRADLPVKQRP